MAGGSGAVSRAWRRLRGPLTGSRAIRRLAGRLLYFTLKGIYLTNRPVAGSAAVTDIANADNSAIGALWHGQHLSWACMKPRGLRFAAMISRSADAELNAMVLAHGGIEAVRGSGGRPGDNRVGKGGATALMGLKKVLDEGAWAVMIADIPKGTPREAGMGVVTLARISGKPIVPAAYATSRRWVIERSWDKTTINLPFGRAAAVFGAPIDVPADADEDQMEAKRRELTEALNAVTARAYAMVDGAR